jgi:hypothetical protein
MIQRIQTLFLALSLAALIAMAFYPVLNLTEFTTLPNKTLETDYYQLLVTGISDPSPDSIPQMSQWVFIPLLAVTILLIVLIIYTIFRFKNRLHQLKLIKMCIFLNIIMVAGIFLNYPKFFTDIPPRMDFGPGAYFPLISLVMLVLAHRYVLKDEKLVKSADRLR